MAKSRIGMMGGSFNPIHRRHLQIAACALEELSLDRILFIPNGNPPHKQRELADAGHRLEMTRLAVIPYDKFTVSDIEITRSGVIYTVDTLHLLRREFPDADFVCLIGEDTMLELEHWRKPEEVFRLCSFAVCMRSGQTAETQSIAEALRARGAKLRFLSLAPVAVSASDIRRRIAMGENVDTMLTPEVYEYIRVTGLYGCPLLSENSQIAYEMLRENLSDERLLHSMAAARTANRLAKIHGLNAGDCELAGLLHDCAKCMDLKTLQQLAREHRLKLTDVELQSNGLLHGPVGAVIAETEYGIRKPEILSAIAAHTTGCAGMSEFDMVIFLADKIEPYRNDIPALDEIRALADMDLYEASYHMLMNSKAHVIQTHRPLHPATDQTIRWMRDRIRERREPRS
ncbi:MAG: nicotinate (nicotinamide) nucleotide adenylyltransferase [Clostridiales bacterium]|nr:nicotinate (nicotinamide) nucleotide adenylyltransferase [Clostridiales bacterium]